MKKLSALFIGVILMVTLLAGCGGTNNPDSGKDPEPPVELEFPDKIVSFSFWDTDIATQGDAETLANKVKRMGYTGADITFRWTRLEHEKGVYGFRYIDAVLDAFAEKGLFLSVSFMYWTVGIGWTDEIELQKLPDGTVYTFSGRGSSPSLSDENTLNVMKNTYAAFTKHVYERYPNLVFRMHARTSQYGELEYFCDAPDMLDYGDPAIANFRAYLKRIHDSVEALNYAAAGNKTFASFDELETLGGKELSDTFFFDWQNFRQEECLKVSAMFQQVQKENAPGVPFALQVGCIWDQAAATRRGIIDPYLASKACDILHTDDGPGFNHNFSMDYSDVDGTVKQASEIDGLWHPLIQSEINGGDRTLTLYRRQATGMGKKGIAYLNIANWAGGINDWSEQLATIPTSFQEAQVRQAADKSTVILINTADMFVKGISAAAMYENTHARLSSNGEKQVRFVSDTQLLEHPELLGEIEEINLGYITGVYTMRAELAALLRSQGKVLTYDKNSTANFSVENEYGYAFPNEEKPTFVASK